MISNAHAHMCALDVVINKTLPPLFYKNMRYAVFPSAMPYQLLFSSFINNGVPESSDVSAEMRYYDIKSKSSICSIQIYAAT